MFEALQHSVDSVPCRDVIHCFRPLTWMILQDSTSECDYLCDAGTVPPHKIESLWTWRRSIVQAKGRRNEVSFRGEAKWEAG